MFPFFVTFGLLLSKQESWCTNNPRYHEQWHFEAPIHSGGKESVTLSLACPAFGLSHDDWAILLL